MKKASYLVLVIVLLAGLLAACSPKATNDLPVVRYAEFKIYDPVYVGIDKGIFEKNGVKVEIVGNLAGPTAIQAVSSGSVDAGASSIPALINANAAALPVMGVTDVQSALPGQPLEQYYVRSDSGIQSVADLKGKKFAVNLWKSSFHYTALMALEQAGLKEDDVEFVLLPFDQQAEALANGSVDVIGLMQPYGFYAEKTYGNKFTELFNAEDVFGQKQFALHFVNRIWAKANPDTVNAFVAGIVESMAWIEANQEEARQIIGKYTKIDPAYVPEYHFQKDGKVIESDVQFWLDYMKGRGDLDGLKWELRPEDIGSNIYHP